jgi:enoyl-CoA hydratase/carnithine racemase
MSTTFQTALYSLEGTVAVITMNRPEALNALSLQLTSDLADAIGKAR